MRHSEKQDLEISLIEQVLKISSKSTSSIKKASSILHFKPHNLLTNCEKTSVMKATLQERHFKLSMTIGLKPKNNEVIINNQCRKAKILGHIRKWNTASGNGCL